MTDFHLTDKIKLAVIICALSVLSLSLVFMVFVPSATSRVYEVYHEKVTEDENAIMKSAKAITSGVHEVAANFKLEVEPSLVEILSFTVKGGKIIGELTNQADEAIYTVQMTVAVKKPDGELKDVISADAEGIGSLRAGKTGYFFLDISDLGAAIGEDDKVECQVVKASKSFLYQ